MSHLNFSIRWFANNMVSLFIFKVEQKQTNMLPRKEKSIKSTTLIPTVCSWSHLPLISPSFSLVIGPVHRSLVVATNLGKVKAHWPLVIKKRNT